MQAFLLTNSKSLHLKFQSSQKMIPQGLNDYRKWIIRTDIRPSLGRIVSQSMFSILRLADDLSEVIYTDVIY
jgi:hypothetical protein